ncbi:MAG: hypothetical protein FJ146_15910 [Deltaproteobacteria bacterium]|nr:hypothetical protein [Deltaproteobacteria bacterium]
MIGKWSVVAAVLGLVSACGGSSFSGESGTVPGRKQPAKLPELGSTAKLPELGDPAVGPGLDVGSDGTLNKCPSKAQKVLVIDLKSGWWSGDGGNFVYRIGNGLTQACGTSVSIEYHHFILAKLTLAGALFGATNGSAPEITNMQLKAPESPTLTQGSNKFEQAFGDPTFTSYTQIWLLSGSSADPADLKANHPFFVEITKRMATTKANIFIGAGYGSITHAAAVADARGLGASFATALPEGNILNPMAQVLLDSSIGADKFDEGHVLLKGMTSIADSLTIAGVKAHGDAIQDKGGIQILATDGLGQATLAVGKSEANGARFVLDGDLPRYYAAWTNQSPDTMKLLQNIMVYLAQ